MIMNLIRCISNLFLLPLLLLLWTVQIAWSAVPFIVDTDMGVDDAMALLYLLQRPDVELKAVTIASDGNAHCTPALRNTLGLLQMSQRPIIPVACGQETPLLGKHHFPQAVLLESDTLAGTVKLLPKVSTKQSPHTAVDLLIKTVQDASQPVTILAIGPLTNIAQALQKAPEIKRNIRVIYIMGGAIDVPGNIPEVDSASKNHTAEWNFYLDPLAAEIVLAQGLPIVLVPLDVTNQLPIDMGFYNAVKNKHHTPAADYVFSMLQNNIKILRAKEWFFWDPLAAVIASDESIAAFKVQRLKVVLSPEIQSGRTIVDNKAGHSVRVVTGVDAKRFTSIFLNYLNNPNSRA
ncbi:nucleoside hydrolase [Legionella septentrionalis]|uniref:Nucleoside hydrolase n=2 Tax=Legionella septentrionalis TaxID=2498109 RepID=A0A3S0X5N7_9GAMM|nr:nucleoside hydrolase [Legionella septentrionalis]RUQ99931.1 nucleoside hydrolase [Legionella septentrionalis]RUR10225.1 nucleoside hydrolase [Legionella septentrionalis]